MVIRLPVHVLLVNGDICHISKGKSSKMFNRTFPKNIYIYIYNMYNVKKNAAVADTVSIFIRLFNFTIFRSFIFIRCHQQLNYHICNTIMGADLFLPMTQLYLAANMCDWWTALSAEQSKHKWARGNPHWLNVVCLTNKLILQESHLFDCHRYIILYCNLDVQI